MSKFSSTTITEAPRSRAVMAAGRPGDARADDDDVGGQIPLRRRGLRARLRHGAEPRRRPRPPRPCVRNDRRLTSALTALCP